MHVSPCAWYCFQVSEDVVWRIDESGDRTLLAAPDGSCRIEVAAARRTGDADESEIAEIHERFLKDEGIQPLKTALAENPYRITAYVTSLDETALDSIITYRRVSSPEVKTQALAPGLAHWFNHQTHHRAQVHTMLTGLTGVAPELDLLIFQRMWAEGLR